MNKLRRPGSCKSPGNGAGGRWKESFRFCPNFIVKVTGIMFNYDVKISILSDERKERRFSERNPNGMLTM